MLKTSAPFCAPPAPPVADAVAPIKEAPLLKDRVDAAFPPAPGAPPTLVSPPSPPSALWVSVRFPVVAPLAALNKITAGPSCPGAPSSPTPAPPGPPRPVTEAEAGPVSDIAVALMAPIAPPDPPDSLFPLPPGAPIAVEVLNAAPPEAVLAKLTAEAPPPFPPLDPGPSGPFPIAALSCPRCRLGRPSRYWSRAQRRR